MINHFSAAIVRTAFPLDIEFVSREQLLLVNYELRNLHLDYSPKANYTRQKYLNRIQQRCTPYGLFAGVSLAQISDKTQIILSGETKRRSKLDTEFLNNLINQLSANEIIKRYLKFYINNTCYSINEKIRFFEFTITSENDKRYSLSSATLTTYLQSILLKAKNGASISELLDSISYINIAENEKLDFIFKLIDNKVLFNELQPNVIGLPVQTFLINKLDEIFGRANEVDRIEIGSIIQKLHAIDNILHAIDQNGLSDTNIANYEKVFNIISELGLSVDPRRLFQVDLIKKTASATISESTINNIISAMHVVSKFLISPKSSLQKFKNEFVKRWQFEEIPLLIALDDELGIGYQDENLTHQNQPLTDLPDIEEASDIITKEFNHRHYSFWLNKILDAKSKKVEEIQISDDELSFFPDQLDFFTSTCSVLASIFKGEDGLEKVYIKGVYNGDGSSLFARFGHSDNEIHKFVKSIHSLEENDDNIIYADIDHLPEALAGNILQRPESRRYHISLLGNTSTKCEFLPLDDLYVSVQYERLILKSKKYNKRVIPKLSAAHNYARTEFPLYRFLCDVSLQGTYLLPKIPLDHFQGYLNFVPRITYNKSTILLAATWFFNYRNYEALLKEVDKDKQYLLLQEFASKWKLPDLILLVEGDNELLINLKDINSSLLFINEIQRKSELVIKEYLFIYGHIIKDVNDKSFTNEIIVPFNVNLGNAKTYTNPIFYDSDTTTRVFPIGSEWLYFKIYINKFSADKLIIEIFETVIQHSITNKWADKWFFVRYIDEGGFHIRLRMHINPKYTREIIDVINKVLFSANKKFIVKNLKTENYERELERYKFINILNAEEIFYHDSVAFVELCKQIKQKKDRLAIAMLLVDTYLTAFGFNENDKLDYISDKPERFIIYFSNRIIRTKLNAEYKSIINLIRTLKDNMTHIPVIQKKLLEQLSIQYSELRTRNSLEQLSNLLNSYIHMSLNRLFESNSNKYEYSTYYLLKKYYLEIKFSSSHN